MNTKHDYNVRVPLAVNTYGGSLSLLQGTITPCGYYCSYSAWQVQSTRYEVQLHPVYGHHIPNSTFQENRYDLTLNCLAAY